MSNDEFLAASDHAHAVNVPFPCSFLQDLHMQTFPAGLQNVLSNITSITLNEGVMQSNA